MAYTKVTVDLRKRSMKLQAHDEMTEIFRCCKLPVNEVNFFAQLFSGIVIKYRRAVWTISKQDVVLRRQREAASQNLKRLKQCKCRPQL